MIVRRFPYCSGKEYEEGPKYLGSLDTLRKAGGSHENKHLEQHPSFSILQEQSSLGSESQSSRKALPSIKISRMLTLPDIADLAGLADIAGYHSRRRHPKSIVHLYLGWEMEVCIRITHNVSSGSQYTRRPNTICP